MITVAIKGPNDAIAKAAAQIATFYQTGGKVVRLYKNVTLPDPIPPCDVCILVTSEDK